MIFQSQQQRQQRSYKPSYILEDNEDLKQKINLFDLTDQQKINLNKQLPRGFCLIKKQQYERLTYNKAPQLQYIDYEPRKIQRIVDIDNPIFKTIQQIWIKKQQQNKKSNKPALQFTMEGRSRHCQKIKNIIQRFRKLIKNTAVESYLNKVGLMLGLNQIQGQNKKGLLTIDTFKARWMLVLQSAKVTTFETDVISQIDEMIEQFLCFVQQARKTQFENNIMSIQKSIDKITRYLSDTADSKAQGNWYIRKKKKPQRNQGYPQKQLLYIGELIKKLPPAYLVGLWQIINQKPFSQAEKKVQQINLAELNNKKIRQIQLYVKGKLSQLYRSREKKAQKMQTKKKSKQKQQVNQQLIGEIKKEQNIEAIQKQIKNDLDELFELKQLEEFQFLDNSIKLENPIKIQKDVSQIEVADVKNKIQKPTADSSSENRSIQMNNSSDSSMITDEDDSDF